MNRPAPGKALAALSLALALLAPCAYTASASDAPPSALAQQAQGLERRGAGTMRFLGLRIYDAVLWSAAPRGAPVDFSRPLALQLRYARSLKGAAIAERSVQEMEKVGAGTPEQRARWGEAMRALFPDVEDGTTLAGLHLPGRGARFFLNGQPLGEVADAAFSQAFFSIWLDARTSAPDLRTALLGAP